MTEKKSMSAALTVGAPRKHTRNDRKMEFLLEKYLELHPDHDGPIDPEAISLWALDTGLYTPPAPVSPIDQLKRRFCRHLSHRYFTDQQNREVRALHAVQTEELTPEGVKQGYLYYPLFSTEPQKIKTALRWRLDGVQNRVIQIETDRQSYNQNNIFGATIEQMSLDFTDAALDSQFPTEYPEAAPAGIDDDDDLPS